MIMAELKGPHVPRWVANGDFAVQPYIVMEHIAGPTPGEEPFAHPCDRRGRDASARKSPPRSPTCTSSTCCTSISSPRTSCSAPTGAAVLIDFGLSRHEQLPDLLEEQFHRPVGTTEYMAPEQLMRVRSDRRSDIFALGAILYQLATGKLPFGIPARMRQVRRRVWRDPIPPRALRPEIPTSAAGDHSALPRAHARRPLSARRGSHVRAAPSGSGRDYRTRRTACTRSDFRTAFARRLRAGKTMRRDSRERDQVAAARAHHPGRRESASRPRRGEAGAARRQRIGARQHAGRAARLRQCHADLAHRDRRERRCSRG